MTKGAIKNFVRRNIYILLIILISLFYLIPLIHPGMFISHDSEPQIVRIAARFKALQDGQIPPRWAGDLNYGYGHPGFIFFYSLSGYIGIFLYLLGFSLQDSYKILMGLTFVLAPIFFYLWTSQFFKKHVAFASSLFYGLAPYSFLDLYVRGHLGESLSLVFIPLVLFIIEKNSRKNSLLYIILGGVSYAFFIHAHSILSLMFTFVFLGYIFLKSWGRKKILISNLAMLVLGLGLSIYFWLPALYEGRFINSKVFLSDWYRGHFLNIANIIYSNWGFGSDVNKPGGLSAQIGPVHVFLAIASLKFLFRKTKEKSKIIFWLIVFVFAIFMSTASSNFIWQRSHILQQFQFPWRFTAMSSFASCVLAGYSLALFNNRKITVLSVIFILLLSIPMAKVVGYVDKSDVYYFSYPGTAAYHNEATTIWVAGDAYQFPKAPIEVISGDAKISEINRKSNLHKFLINANTDSVILDNTVYFPGWQVRVNGKKVPIEFQDPNHKGFITFQVAKGEYNVEVKFAESPIRLISNLASLATIFCMVLLYLFRKKVQVLFLTKK